jgi:hypothetical protein
VSAGRTQRNNAKKQILATTTATTATTAATTTATTAATTAATTTHLPGENALVGDKVFVGENVCGADAAPAPANSTSSPCDVTRSSERGVWLRAVQAG